MLNKKGFTIAEVVVSFSLVSVILASMVGTTIYYRDKLKQEEVITQLVDFKNTITNTIYADILTDNSNKLIRAQKCISPNNCVNFTDTNNNTHTLSIVEYATTNSSHKRGVYLSYDGTLYMLPDSDLGQGDTRICDFIGGFIVNHDKVGNVDLYTVKTTFKHKDLNKEYDIIVTLTHYN